MGSGIRLQGRGLILCTDCFNLPDVVLLINVLVIKYRLQCNLIFNESKPRIYIYRSSYNSLMVSLKPYTFFS